MTREQQKYINELCETVYKKARYEYMQERPVVPIRLRSCTAFVYESTNYYYLRSYNVLVAIIDKRTDTLYDILRMVYGYTSTSAQHIRKFEKDYSSGANGYGCTRRFRYYDIDNF